MVCQPELPRVAGMSKSEVGRGCGDFLLSVRFGGAVGEIQASGAISAWLYDRWGYNPEKKERVKWGNFPTTTA